MSSTDAAARLPASVAVCRRIEKTASYAREVYWHKELELRENLWYTALGHTLIAFGVWGFGGATLLKTTGLVFRGLPWQVLPIAVLLGSPVNFILGGIIAEGEALVREAHSQGVAYDRMKEDAHFFRKHELLHMPHPQAVNRLRRLSLQMMEPDRSLLLMAENRAAYLAVSQGIDPTDKEA